MIDFRTRNIWKVGIAIVKQVYRLAEFLPVQEKYGLRSQICRSAVSIPSNIAEGCSRRSQIDFKRFPEMTLGSSFEFETQLIIIEELSIIPSGDIRVVLDQLNKEQMMINNLISKLKAKSQQPTANN
ncbi:MAG: four helix bundle protein [bacterium]